MYMSEKMDEGDILSVEEIDISPHDTTPDIFMKFEEITPKILTQTLQNILDKKITPCPQPHQHATYCRKITKEDGHILFSSQNGQHIYNTYRAYMPWPGIYTVFEGKILKILSCQFQHSRENIYPIGQFFTQNGRFFIQCLDGYLEIFEVQLEGKKKMNIVDFVNGYKHISKYIFP